MCRLRTNFARLGDPVQGLHKGKQANRAYGPLEMHPSAACGGVSPRESVSRDFQSAVAPLQITFACHRGGEILAALCLELLMKEMLSGE